MAPQSEWEDVTPSRPPTIFPAAFPGRCNNCGDHFDTDDPIGYLNNEIACEICTLEVMESDG